MPLVLQMVFGSLLSMALLFYWFSGAVAVSWPLFLLLIGLIVFNESFRHLYLRPLVQVGLFAFVSYVYFSVLFPYLFRSLGLDVVLLGGAVSLGCSLLVALLVIRSGPVARTQRWWLLSVVVGVFGVLTALQVSNLVPPIPLSLREAGVYRDVHRIGNDYQLVGDPETFWQQFLQQHSLQLDATGHVYVYTTVYSPADLSTTIYHRWEYYNPTSKTWEEKGVLSYAMQGGRNDGYRGFTFKTIHQPGKWRVTVQTERGQALGRIAFELR